MDHFDIVLAVSRMALEGDRDKVIYHLERLHEALKKAEPDQAAKISRLLSRNERRQSVAPMRIEQMRAGRPSGFKLGGEALSRATPLPRDKETSTPLATVIFPSDEPVFPPVLGGPLAAAIEDLLAEWQRVEELSRLGVRPSLRCLFFGSPGVGKTMLARYVAARLGIPCVEAKLDGIVSSFLGTTARNIGALFDFANKYKCLLFLDEFDAIAKARDDSQEIGEIKRVVNTLLQCLDSRNDRGFTLAATNHDHLLDPAIWRRFEARINIPLPDEQARRIILQKLLRPITINENELTFLVWVTAEMSGADLETLVAGGKRYLVMNETAADPSRTASQKNGPVLLAALKRQAILNAGLFDKERLEALLSPEEDLTRNLIARKILTQTAAGELIGKSQSAVSRQKNKNEPPREKKPRNSKAGTQHPE